MKKVAIVFLMMIVGGNVGMSSMLQIIKKQISGNDKILLFTDRNLYAVGEQLYFASFIYNSSDTKSRVLYVELISQDGKQIQSSKFKIENNKSNGSISISKDIPSGNYFLKAYTRWMRNFNPAEYSYTQIIVVNSNNHSHQPSIINGDSSSIKFSKIEKSEHPIGVDLNRVKYQPREKAHLSITVDNSPNNYQWLCLTVAPKEIGRAHV